MRLTLSRRSTFRIVLLFILAAAMLILPVPLSPKIGAIDFRPYWSSTYLLAHGQDFSDPVKLFAVEQTQTSWTESFTMYAWFAPTGNVFILPYTLVPFQRATYYWLLTNIVVVFFSALLIWEDTKVALWIPLVSAFGFSMTLLSLIFGQVNTLVLLGLALFLYFNDQQKKFAAGASLLLTTIKPHLVILTLPLLLLSLLRRRERRALAGFGGACLACVFVLFALYPAWPLSFWQLVTQGMGAVRETPTLSGLLVAAGEYGWRNWIWVIGLILVAPIWWRNGKAWDLRTLLDVSIIASLLVSPIGWSYDQVMLLFPVLRVLRWAVDGTLGKKDAAGVAIVLLVANGITFYERVVSPGELWYVWVPLVAGGVYLYAWQRRHVDRIRAAQVEQRIG